MSQSDTRKPCRYCGCPEASAKDWEEVEPGKGEELGLCWDGEVCRHDPERAIDRLMQERDAAREDARKLAELLTNHHALRLSRAIFGAEIYKGFPICEKTIAALAAHEALAKK